MQFNRKVYQMLTILSVFLISSVVTLAQPNIKFNKKEHRFGDVLDGSLPEYTFTFKNTGNEDLVLKNVQSSCGCTSPSWPRDPIAPGDSGEIKVVFNTRGYKNKDFVKSIMITSNAVARGKQRTDALIIRGHVVPKNSVPQYAIEASSLYHNFGKVQQGKKIKYSFKLYNKGDSLITIDKLELLKGYHVEAKAKPNTLKPNDSVTISYTFNTKLLSPGEYSERIKITTSLNPKSTRRLTKKGYLIKLNVLSKEDYKEYIKNKRKSK